MLPSRWHLGPTAVLFVLLAIPMVTLTIFTLRDAAVEPIHRASLVAAMALAAGVSAWIIARF